jgi:ankyrin repeat protein
MYMKRMIGLSCVAGLFSIAALAAAPSEVADAAMNKNKAAVKTLLQQKADVNALQADGATALIWAARNDDAEMADMLIKAGANVKVANREGATALYAACVNGSAGMVQRLLKAGAEANGTVLLNGETPLMICTRTGSVEAMKVLIDAGADVNAKEKLRETTAVMWAAEQNHTEAIKLLASKGADVNAQGKKFAPKRGRYVEDDGPQPEPTFTGGLTPLVIAAREDALDSVKVLLDLKADPNKTSADGSTALLVSVQNGLYDVANYLVEHGADINKQNVKGWSPLYLAIKHRTVETGTIPLPNADQALPFVSLLLDRGVNVNVRAKADTEIRNGFRATWLLENGATPFLRAALCGDIEVMRMLLAHGADPNINTADGTTPLMAAAGVGYTDGFIHDISEETTIEAMKLILDIGADVNAQNKRGLTALHGAAHKASLAEIQLLVDRGADLGIRDSGEERFGGSGAKKPLGLLPLNWAEGVPIGPQSAIYHAEAVDLITKLMKEKGVPLPTTARTVGGNARANTIERKKEAQK